jgi:RNA polymerase sigma-70 factor, ECF subfamily
VEKSKLPISTEEIWKEFSDRLKQFILYRVHSEHDADDILQDVFCKIHKNINQLKDDNTLQAWIYQITRNTIIDYYRHHKVMVELSQVPQEKLSEPVTSLETPKEMASCLKLMIDQLPEKYRQALTLTEFEGLTQKELAIKLGTSLSGAKSRVQRARKKLKETLLDSCQFEFDRLGNILDYQPKKACSRYCAIGEC